MFLTMGLVLAIVSTYTEVKLVHGSKAIDRLYTHGIGRIEGVWFNTAGSFLISWVLGLMFAADGLTVMFGAVLSTGFSQAYFSSEKFCHDQGWSWRKFRSSISNGAGAIARTKSNAVSIWHDFQQPLKDLKNFILFTVKVITFPFVLVRKASASYTQRKATI